MVRSGWILKVPCGRAGGKSPSIWPVTSEVVPPVVKERSILSGGHRKTFACAVPCARPIPSHGSHNDCSCQPPAKQENYPGRLQRQSKIGEYLFKWFSSERAYCLCTTTAFHSYTFVCKIICSCLKYQLITLSMFSSLS